MRCAPTKRDKDCMSSPALRFQLALWGAFVLVIVHLLQCSFFSFGEFLQAPHRQFRLAFREATDAQLSNLFVEMRFTRQLSVMHCHPESRRTYPISSLSHQPCSERKDQSSGVVLSIHYIVPLRMPEKPSLHCCCRVSFLLGLARGLFAP